MKRLFLLTIILISLFISSCESITNPEEELTAATQTGALTFSCRVDGKVWLPYVGYVLALSEFSSTYEYSNPYSDRNRLSLYAQRTTDYESVISIQCDSVRTAGNHLISAAYYYDKKTNVYFNELIGANYLNVTLLDTTKRIISGTFAFTVKEDKGVIRTITDGRFDTKY